MREFNQLRSESINLSDFNLVALLESANNSRLSNSSKPSNFTFFGPNTPETKQNANKEKIPHNKEQPEKAKKAKKAKKIRKINRGSNRRKESSQVEKTSLVTFKFFKARNRHLGYNTFNLFFKKGRNSRIMVEDDFGFEGFDLVKELLVDRTIDSHVERKSWSEPTSPLRRKQADKNKQAISQFFDSL